MSSNPLFSGYVTPEYLIHFHTLIFDKCTNANALTTCSFLSWICTVRVVLQRELRNSSAFHTWRVYAQSGMAYETKFQGVVFTKKSSTTLRANNPLPYLTEKCQPVVEVVRSRGQRIQFTDSQHWLPTTVGGHHTHKSRLVTLARAEKIYPS